MIKHVEVKVYPWLRYSAATLEILDEGLLASLEEKPGKRQGTITVVCPFAMDQASAWKWLDEMQWGGVYRMPF